MIILLTRAKFARARTGTALLRKVALRMNTFGFTLLVIPSTSCGRITAVMRPQDVDGMTSNTVVMRPQDVDGMTSNTAVMCPQDVDGLTSNTAVMRPQVVDGMTSNTAVMRPQDVDGMTNNVLLGAELFGHSLCFFA